MKKIILYSSLIVLTLLSFNSTVFAVENSITVEVPAGNYLARSFMEFNVPVSYTANVGSTYEISLVSANAEKSFKSNYTRKYHPSIYTKDVSFDSAVLTDGTYRVRVTEFDSNGKKIATGDSQNLITVTKVKDCDLRAFAGVSIGSTKGDAVRYYYTANNSERGATDYMTQSYQGAYLGITDEGIQFYTPESNVPGTLPMYRMYNSVKKDHYYVIDQIDLDNAKSKGYVSQGVVGYVLQTQLPNTVPLISVIDVNTHRLITRDISLYDYQIKKGIFKEIKTLGYVFVPADRDGTPYFNFSKRLDSDYREVCPAFNNKSTDLRLQQIFLSALGSSTRKVYEDSLATVKPVVATTPSEETNVTTCPSPIPTFSLNATVGDSNDVVHSMKCFLSSKGYLLEKYLNNYFGNNTKVALAAYQTSKGIQPNDGVNFGPITRAAMNADLAAGVTLGSITVNTPNGGIYDNGATQSIIIIGWNAYNGDFENYTVTLGNTLLNVEQNITPEVINKLSNGYNTTSGQVQSWVSGWTGKPAPTEGYYFKVFAVKKDGAGSRNVAVGKSSSFSIRTDQISSISPLKGSGGEVVTIKGKNLSADSKIIFLKGGVWKGELGGPSILSVNSSNITFTLSKTFTNNIGAGLYQVGLQNSIGVKSNTLNFEVVATPAPAPTASLTANDQSGDVTVYVGEPLTYKWTSTNATIAKSSYTSSPSSCGSSNSWVASTTSGFSSTQSVPTSAANCTFNITYSVSRNNVSNFTAAPVLKLRVLERPKVVQPVTAPTPVVLATIPDPTATLTLNGQTGTVNVRVGDVLNYVWSSTNASSGTSVYTSPTCGSGKWAASDTGNKWSPVTPSNNAGCVFKITYTVTQTRTGKTATSELTVNVASVPSPVVQPTAQVVSTSSTFAIPVPVANPTIPAPTATFTLNGQTGTVNVRVGDVLNYVWSSTNASSGSSTYTSPTCGSGKWAASDTGNKWSPIVPSNNIGCSYTITYTVTQPSTGKTAKAVLVVNVASVPVSANSAAASNAFNWLFNSVKNIFK